MKNNLQDILKKFSSEIGETMIATGIVNIDGGLEAYVASDQLGEGYNVQRSASIFAMIVNVLNKTLCEIYEAKEDVDEVLVTTQNSYFIVKMIETEKYFHGATFTFETDINHIRQTMKNYKSLFAEELKC